MLIQAGFPIVNEFGEYPEQIPPPRHPNADGDDQTQEVVRLGNVHLGERFAVQHNGLQACPATGECRDPNYIVRNKGELGWVTGLQTTNAGNPAIPVRRPDPGLQPRDPALGAAERRQQRAERRLRRGLRGAVLGREDAVGARYPTASGKRTVGQWDDFFHTRRRTLFPDLPDPEPTTHAHTFARTQAGTAPQSLRYANGSTCAAPLQSLPGSGTISSCRPS